MKTLFVLLLLILLCIVVVLIIRNSREQVWIPPTGPTQPDPGLRNPVEPEEPKGVLPKEQAVLDWLKENGCKVEVPVSHALLDKVYEKKGIPYDKYYEISWDVEFVNIEPAMKPGDPTPPRPGSYVRFTRTFPWDSARNSYDDLVKIKQGFQKDVAGGFVIK